MVSNVMVNEVSTEKSKLYTLQLSSKLESIVQLESFIDRIAAEYNISDENYGNIMTAINEATMNAIVHGNKNDESKKVYINLEVQNNHKLIFTIADEGEGFDFRAVADPTLPENLEKDCGRGIFIMKHLADRLVYNDSGTQVEIQFNL
ncbi:ATP-binding protein [Solitalea koreensis]|uniref:Serine/threonine-protein kinase RsbW n=1 Tax=Solitalea koreensis TaxID=543615 RepID=A0A521C1P7_9SPHI|nr:ATP-binding protein [Solitalea koreensis]SMO53396.1 serine/threonine-protein kinase RsbW [Solitalea koreensis]